MKHSSYFHHHHHRCSDLRQVPGTHSLHSFLLSALLFIFTNEPSIRSSIIPLLGLPRGLFLNILPSNTSLSSPFPLSTCPRTFHKIIYHSSSWPASRPLPQHSSLQHIPQQSIPSKHMSKNLP